MIVFLHSNHPRYIVECDGFQAEIGIVGDFADFLDEGVQIRGVFTVDGCYEVCRRKVVLVGWGTTALKEVKAYRLA